MWKPSNHPAGFSQVTVFEMWLFKGGLPQIKTSSTNLSISPQWSVGIDCDAGRLAPNGLCFLRDLLNVFFISFLNSSVDITEGKRLIVDSLRLSLFRFIWLMVLTSQDVLTKVLFFSRKTSSRCLVFESGN